MTAGESRPLEVVLAETWGAAVEAERQQVAQLVALTGAVRALASHLGVTIDNLPDAPVRSAVVPLQYADALIDTVARQSTAGLVGYALKLQADAEQRLAQVAREAAQVDLEALLAAMPTPVVQVDNVINVPEPSPVRKVVSYDARGRVASIEEEPA